MSSKNRVPRSAFSSSPSFKSVCKERLRLSFPNNSSSKRAGDRFAQLTATKE